MHALAKMPILPAPEARARAYPLSGVRVPIVLGLLVAATTAFGTTAEHAVAWVNGTVITESRVQAKMQPVIERLQQKQPTALNDALRTKIRRKAIDLLIEETVVLTSQRAQALPDAAKIAKSPQLAIAKVRHALADACAPCTEDEAGVQYATNAKRYLSEGRVKVSMIRLEPGSVETQNLKRFAVGVQNRVGEAGDEDWNAVAMEYSSGPKAGNGGHWDWCAPSELPDDLGRSALSLHHGEVTRCARDDVYYVLRLNDSEEPRQLSLEEARVRVEADVMRKKAAEAWRVWLASEMEKAEIRKVSRTSR